jgi:hypothetical protein
MIERTGAYGLALRSPATLKRAAEARAHIAKRQKAVDKSKRRIAARIASAVMRLAALNHSREA